MADGPLVSIVIPVYNAVPFLERAAQSALAQTYPHTEVLLVENNSTDGSAALARRLAGTSMGVRYLEARRQGASAARNLGWNEAKGTWIQFLDADDTLDPTKIADQVGLLAGSDARWVIGAYRNRYADGTILDSLPHEDPWKGLVYRYRIGYTCSNLYHRSALETVGGWDERLPNGTDPALHFHLLRAEIPYLITGDIATTYHHHDGPDRLSASRPVAGNLQDAELRAAVMAHLREYRTAYWADNRLFYEGALVQRLRILATHDLDVASAAYSRWFPEGWNPPLSGRGLAAGMVAPYIRAMYRVVGFRRTEWWRLWVAGQFTRTS